MEDREIKKINDENKDRPANHQPEFDILAYAKKQKLIMNFKANPENLAAFKGIDLDELDEEELIDLISDEELLESGEEDEENELSEGEEGDEELESGDEEDMDGESIDPEELDSDGFEEMDADEELGDSDEEDAEDAEEDEGKLGKRKSPTDGIEKAKKSKGAKKVKEDGDGPESTVNSEDSGTEETSGSEIDLSDDEGFTKQRRDLGFIMETDIYTHKMTRAEQRRAEKDDYTELIATKKMKHKIDGRGQKTNKAKLVNKPFMMTVDKKAKKLNSYKQLRVRSSKLKNQLGHIHKGVTGNLKSKKRALKR